jgi:phosphoribosylformylglycinamidine synthase
VDLADTQGEVYDVDFFMEGDPGAMRVTETTIHKINGQPFYAWEQKEDRSWHRVPIEGASRQLLGVISGQDEFDFFYRAKLPTVGGEVNFHKRYNGNCLVNAFAAGLLDADKIFLSEAKGVGMPVVYLGSKTGRDGIHGASMASAEFDDNSAEKRPTVQVGDPFSEKLLLEASLELMASGAVIAIQDMGAAGLTCSAVEMGAKGNLGLELNLDAVPTREPGMTAYEMMLSESQERMLMVLHPHLEQQAEAIFRKWGLDFAIVGETTDTLRFVVKHHGDVMADLPIKDLGDQAPEYDRPWVEPKKQPVLDPAATRAPDDYRKALLDLLGSPNLSSRRWVWEQYDHLIQGNTVQLPGGDAAVVRVERPNGGKAKGLGFTCDVTPRYVEADPYEGGKQAIAESWRNLNAVGALPIAVTDNLNFGNPERPEIMGQFVKALEGLGDACRALDMPIVSGNVSLYNETNGVAILPTPAIGAVGLMDDVTRTVGVAFAEAEDVVVLIGDTTGWMGQSSYLSELYGLEEGAPPPVDLAVEKKNGDFVREAVIAGRVTAAHDLSDGGLLVALAEMAMAGKKGARILLPEIDVPLHAFLFGEDQARYVVTASPAEASRLIVDAAMAGVPATAIGAVGGDALVIGEHLNVAVTDLSDRHESWFPGYMSGV